MARNYINWYNKRSNNTTLHERPAITNIVDGKKRYYSSLDAEIFIGDSYIDEITNLVYSVQQQSLPVYGYNSYTFDDIILGARIVQGQFSVNYVQADLINSLTKTKRSRRMYGDDNPVTSTFKGSKERLTKPSWDSGFNIVIGFGDNNKSVSDLKSNLYRTYTVLDCCQIIGSSVQLDITGAPIQEVYSFVARDILYKNATDKDDSKDNEKTGTTDSSKTSSSNADYTATVDIKGEEAKFTIETTNNIKSVGGSFSLQDIFKNKKLNSLTQLDAGDKKLTIIMDKNKSKLLKDEIIDNNMEVLRAQLTWTYIDNEDKTTDQPKNKIQPIQIKIIK